MARYDDYGYRRVISPFNLGPERPEKEKRMNRDPLIYDENQIGGIFVYRS
jgi:hypothetical protein